MAPDDLTEASENLDNVLLAKYIKQRFELDKIYTYVGGILLAVNPFKKLGIYGPNESIKYIKVSDKSTLPPHIFYIADNAYQSMVSSNSPQTCVVSGESGAGKTESSKLLISQILDCSALGMQAGQREMDVDRERHPVEEKIIDMNPILEAFGNAKTVMNNNSSRFGKYTELQFSSTGKVIGASLSHYLLEKGRVVSQNEGELNYHVFSRMYAGLDKRLKSYFKLCSYSDHRYLPEYPEAFGNGFEGFEQSINEAEVATLKQEWDEMQQALFTVGFTDAERDDIIAILAGILHLGDVDFEPSGDDGSSVVPSTRNKILAATDALALDDQELIRGLTTGEITVRGETTVTMYKPAQSGDTRDGAAKALFERLFSWLVRRIDAVLAANPANSNMEGDSAPAPDDTGLQTIGILDIFGFEDFRVNGFEQFCINLANEQLQQYFNHHIFKFELEEYKREGLDDEVYGKIKYSDNADTLELVFQKQTGLIPLLNEASKFQTSTPTTLTDKLVQSLGAHDKFLVSKTPGQFGIMHYAGQVTYQANGFLEKNRDVLPPLVVDHFAMSSNPLVQLLFSTMDAVTGQTVRHGGKSKASAHANKGSRHANAKGKGSRHATAAPKSKHGNRKSKGFFSGRFSKSPGAAKRGRASTVSTKFQQSLNRLMGKMQMATPHFVRCIKPNAKKVSGLYDPDMVLKQMRYNGLLATVQMRRAGFPHRLPHAMLLRKYQGLVRDYSEKMTPSKKSSQSVLTELTR